MKKAIFILFFLPVIINAQNRFQRLKYSMPLEFGSGFFNGVGDNILFKYNKTIFADNPQKYPPQKWNPAISWKNKWELDTEGNLIFPLRERYPFSSTALVWTTDKWHGLKTASLTAGQLAIITYNPQNKQLTLKQKLIDFLILKLTFSAGWTAANYLTAKR